MIPLNYGCSGSVTAQIGTCSLCGHDKLCLVIDGSEGEYGEILCCRQCIDYCFEQAAVPTDSKDEAGAAADRDTLRQHYHLDELDAAPAGAKEEAR